VSEDALTGVLPISEVEPEHLAAQTSSSLRQLNAHLRAIDTTHDEVRVVPARTWPLRRPVFRSGLPIRSEEEIQTLYEHIRLEVTDIALRESLAADVGRCNPVTIHDRYVQSTRMAERKQKLVHASEGIEHFAAGASSTNEKDAHASLDQMGRRVK
jgi:hypothetical protein